MILGLTGGIASGKTFCSNWFAEQGVAIVDADIIAREVVLPGSDGLKALHALLGDDILQSHNILDRAVLRKKMFEDDILKQQVNSILHPKIRVLAQKQLSSLLKKHSFAIYSAPLLFESGSDRFCDFIITVDLPVILQILRGSIRDNVSQSDIEKIIKVQTSREERLTQSHFVIDNSGSPANTIEQCIVLLNKFRIWHC